MSRLLKNKSVAPPDGFRYVHPETGHETKAMDYWTFVEQAKEHRKANGLPVPYDFEAVAEDQLCQTIPPEYCQYEKEGSWVNLRLALGDIITVTKSLIDSAKGDYVSQEEAERRAAICSRCFLNVRAQGCGSCAQIANYVAPGKTTSLDNDLNNCAACGCYLKPKVHMKLTTLESSLTSSRQEALPSFCWLLKNGINYRSSPRTSGTPD